MISLFSEIPALFAWLWSLTLQASLLILLVFAAQWIFRSRLSPSWCYFLWLLVIGRMLIPFSWENNFNLSPLRPALVTSFVAPENSPSPSVTAVPPPSPSMASSEIPQPKSINLAFLWPVLWLLGVCLLGGRLIWESWRWSQKIAAEPLITESRLLEIVESAKKEIGVQIPVNLIATTLVETPMLCGYVRPRILLPSWMIAEFNPAELRYVILHELGHVKRHDIAINWIASLLQIVHWFNPLVWLAFAQMRADREQACDNLVLSQARENENTSYGETLLKLLSRFAQPSLLPSLAGILEYRQQLKERLTLIRHFSKNASRHVLTGAFVLLTLTGLSFTCLGGLTPTQNSTESVSLLGTWKNLDPQSRSYGKLAIVEGTNKAFLDLWGVRGGSIGSEPDSRTELPLTPDEARNYDGHPISTVKNHGFIQYEHTLSLNRDILILRSYGVYLDNSGRQNYTVTASFSRENSQRALETSRPIVETVEYDKGQPPGIEEQEGNPTTRPGYKIVKFLSANVSLEMPKKWVRSKTDGIAMLPSSEDFGPYQALRIYQIGAGGTPESNLLEWFEHENKTYQKSGAGPLTLAESSSVTTASGLRGHRLTVMNNKQKINETFYCFINPLGGMFYIRIPPAGSVDFKRECDEMVMNSLKSIARTAPQS